MPYEDFILTSALLRVTLHRSEQRWAEALEMHLHLHSQVAVLQTGKLLFHTDISPGRPKETITTHHTRGTIWGKDIMISRALTLRGQRKM